MKRSEWLFAIIGLITSYIIFPLILSLYGLPMGDSNEAFILIGTPTFLFLITTLISWQSFKSKKIIKSSIFFLVAIFLLMLAIFLIGFGLSFKDGFMYGWGSGAF